MYIYCRTRPLNSNRDRFNYADLGAVPCDMEMVLTLSFSIYSRSPPPPPSQHPSLFPSCCHALLCSGDGEFVDWLSLPRRRRFITRHINNCIEHIVRFIVPRFNQTICVLVPFKLQYIVLTRIKKNIYVPEKLFYVPLWYGWEYFMKRNYVVVLFRNSFNCHVQYAYYGYPDQINIDWWLLP